MVSKDVAVVSYQGLQVDYDEGLTCSGLKFVRQHRPGLRLLPRPQRARSKSEAGPGRCSNACSGKSAPRPTPPATNRGRHTGMAGRGKFGREEQSWRHERSSEGSTPKWQTLQPFWGKKDYDGERKMLYDLLEPGEDVELLHSCGFETKNVMWASRHDRGVVVATGRRIILLNRGRLSKNRFGLTYLEIDEITEPEPARIRLRGSGNATGSEPGAVFDLDLQFAAADFSRFVRGHLLSDEQSVAAAFSHVLALGEQVRHWAHCSAGQETVFHNPGSGGGPSGSHTPESWGNVMGWLAGARRGHRAPYTAHYASCAHRCAPS